MTVWFTSDTHFQYGYVANLRDYGPAQTWMHDEGIIDVWNSLVRKDDIVWHLGDVGLGARDGVLRLVDRLNGRKYLVSGNHDPVWSGHRDSHKVQATWLEHFESIHDYKKIKIGGMKPSAIMTHLPMLGMGEGDRELEERYQEFRLSRVDDRWNLHGHTHSDKKLDGMRSIHVGWDAWHRPVHHDEIWQIMKDNA